MRKPHRPQPLQENQISLPMMLPPPPVEEKKKPAPKKPDVDFNVDFYL